MNTWVLVHRQRLLKLPGPRRHFDLPGQDLPRCDRPAVIFCVCIVSGRNDGALKRDACEKSLASAIGIDCGNRCYIRLGSAPHGTGSHAYIASELHVSSMSECLNGLMSIENENELGFRCSDLKAESRTTSRD